MKNLRRRLSSLLVLAMLLSLLPVGTLAAEPQPLEEEQQFNLADSTSEPEEEPLYVEVNGQKLQLEPVTISTYSMLPLPVKYYTLDLRGYFPEEMKEFNISDMLRKLAPTSSGGDPATTDPNEVAAWAKWRYLDENGDYVGEDASDDYTLVGADKTIDLSSSRLRGGTIELELIIGTADQLNPDNTRYRIHIPISEYRGVLIPTMYSVDNPREKIDVYDTYLGPYSDVDDYESFQMGVDPKQWSQGQETYLGLTLGSDFANSPDLTVAVYSGRYDTEVAAIEAVAQGKSAVITGQLMDQNNIAAEGGYRADYSWNRNPEEMPGVTFVFYRNGKTVNVMPLTLYMFEDWMYLSLSSPSMYEELLDTSRDSVEKHRYYTWSEDDAYEINNIVLENGNPANRTYYIQLEIHNPDGSSGVGNVKKAVVGYYETEAQIPASAVDIKEQLFSDASQPGGGYGTDYSQGVIFTVVDTNDDILWLSVKTIAGEEYLPPEADPLSEDTYFRMKNALYGSNSSLHAYVMPYDSDSYYSNGFQTVFLLDGSGNRISDNTKIKPDFWTYNNVNVFAGHTEKGQPVASAEKQTSRVTEHTFENGKAIQYSAAAENNQSLKNYWVTFLTQQTGPKLFVNATNEPSLWEEEHEGQGDKIPVREVFLTNDFNYRHDVFFANIGDAELTNISVKLENPQNVALDEYWTIGDTKELAPFDSVYDGSYNGNVLVANVGKIRLVPQRDEGGYIKAGEISGTLVISAAGQEDVRIKLKGTAGTPKITTETVRNGVKYVHYSSLIQTNNMYDSGAVTFSVTGGRLPRGMNLKANGELYGVPTETGTFTFTATATIEVDGKTYSDSKEFTFTIADNTKENVELGNDDTAIGYPLLDRILDLDISGEVHEDYSFLQQNMRSNGPFNEFMNVYLDGRLLADGQDYDAEEGSTRITVRAQTFRNAGNGTHTISAEFRTGQDENGTMHRTAQNFSIKGLPSSGGSSGGGGGGSSSESGKYNITVPSVSHGKITASEKNAGQGTVVYLTVTPDEGYKLDSITITGPRGKEVPVTRESDGRYSFQMPNGTAQISVKFVPVGSGQPEQPTQPTPAGTTPFVDMLESDWFYSAVAQVYEKGWMTGTAPDNFAPRAKTSRGMIVTILHKLEGNPEAEGSYFADVPLNCYYTKAVSWAAEQGIISGYGNGRFGPDDSLTREQIVMILYSYAKYKGMDVSAQSGLEQFTDLDQLSSEAQQAMSWAHGVGLISGKGDGILDPAGPATRAEMAALLVQFVSLMESAQ